jgi:hypothetical protein
MPATLGQENRLTKALAARTSPAPLLDLTGSNPTSAGLVHPDDVFALLGDPGSRLYEPEARGRLEAREAVARYYASHGVPAQASRILLSASSSETYSWLFKLLAGPGETVLVPAPSYPLLDALAGLEAVRLERYRLPEEDGWEFHAGAVEEKLDELAHRGQRVAAVVVVNPNNPTGTWISRGEATALLDLAARHGFGVISDEVFVDDGMRARPRDGVAVLAALESDALVFSLGRPRKRWCSRSSSWASFSRTRPAPLLAAALRAPRVDRRHVSLEWARRCSAPCRNSSRGACSSGHR